MLDEKFLQINRCNITHSLLKLTLSADKHKKGKVTIIYIAVLHNRGLLQDRFTIPRLDTLPSPWKCTDMKKQGQIQAWADWAAAPHLPEIGASHGCKRQCASDMGMSYDLNP